MKSITQNDHADNGIINSIKRFSKEYRIYSLLKACNAYKSKGYSVIRVFLYLFSIVFTNRSMYMNFLTGKHTEEFGKDTVYRFLNSTSINWGKFTSLLAAYISSKSIVPLTDDERKNVLIIDDTLFERPNSKKVELLSKVFDHVDRKFKRGFRLLTLGWSDGNTFLPVSSRLLASEKQENIYQGIDSNLDKRTVGYKCRMQAQTKATSVMLDLIDQAIQAKIQASYVLFDTWFCSPSSLLAVKKRGLDIIAMAKKSSKIHYRFNGEEKSCVKEIFKANKKRRGRSRYLLSVEIEVFKENESIPARLVYVRNRQKRKDWLVLISTDMSLTEDEIIRLYGKRWDIEVFFKVCKSYLRLAKECRSLSYDAMTAHVAIVFSRYMMLSLEGRLQEDDRSLGEIFFYISDELADITWEQSLYLLMQALMSAIEDKLTLTQKQLDDFLEAFLSMLPAHLQRVLVHSA